MAKLIERVAPANAIITLDAGTFGAPFYRKVAWTPPQRLLAPFPAPWASACRPASPPRCGPERLVIGLVGDGGALMTGGEYAVAVARGVPLKLMLSDNGSYARIRIHQEQSHPGRVSGTSWSTRISPNGAPPSGCR